MSIFGNRKKKQVEIPAVLQQQENPVNYNSVLDYLVGLSKQEYDKMFKVSGIYRNANKEAAKVLGVKDEPTTQLVEEKPSDDEIDEAIDTILDSDIDSEFLFEDEEIPQVDGIKKAQEPSKEKKVKVN